MLLSITTTAPTDVTDGATRVVTSAYGVAGRAVTKAGASTSTDLFTSTFRPNLGLRTMGCSPRRMTVASLPSIAYCVPRHAMTSRNLARLMLSASGTSTVVPGAGACWNAATIAPSTSAL